MFYQRDRFSVAPAYLLTLLVNMQPLMETLLECGANANLMSPPNVVSPLYYLMRVVCSMSPSLLGATVEQVNHLVLFLMPEPTSRLAGRLWNDARAPSSRNVRWFDLESLPRYQPRLILILLLYFICVMPRVFGYILFHTFFTNMFVSSGYKCHEYYLINR